MGKNNTSDLQCSGHRYELAL